MPIEINGLNSGRAQQSSDREMKKVSKASTGNSKAAGQGGGGSKSDSVTLTGTAARLKEIEQSLAEQPVVDAERVHNVQTAIKNGEFEIQPDRVADKIIDMETSLDKP